MYKAFYGFTDNPFTLTPNSRFFFNSDRHREALSVLLYAIQQRKGFVVLTGDIGAGKTTVCRTLLNNLDPNTATALITNTHISGKDLLISILDELGVAYAPGSKARLLNALNMHLIDCLRNNKNVVLIIDEAQNLTPSVLEEVRMISNLETENEKLIQIIFLGQPELKQKLALPRLEQLRQRIALYFHLTPLSRTETIDYIRHRLATASGTDREYFTPDAMEAVFEFSGGVPRLINQVCDSALLTGYIHERPLVDRGIIEETIAESPVTQIAGRTRKVHITEQMLQSPN